MKSILFAPIIFSFLLFSCKSFIKENPAALSPEEMEAREDSIELRRAYDLQANIHNMLGAVVQTEPVAGDPLEDAADDPAIWYNEADPEATVIYGTNKKKGIHAYDLDGNEMRFYPFGKINNIDVRNGVRLGDELVDVLGGSNRSDNSIVLYRIDSAGNLSGLLRQNYLIDTVVIDEVYGFCMYKNDDGRGFALVNGKNGVIHQYALNPGDEGWCELELVNDWKVDSQPEGMVADDEYGLLYLGEEDRGIWKLSLTDPSAAPVLIPGSQKENNPAIEYDVEGLAIFSGESGQGFLVASSQGNFSYAIFDRMENHYIGSFIIAASNGIDGVEETDGLDILSKPLGTKFPDGILVVQDGFNFSDSVQIGQNFKYVQMTDVLRLLKNLE